MCTGSFVYRPSQSAVSVFFSFRTVPLGRTRELPVKLHCTRLKRSLDDGSAHVGSKVSCDKARLPAPRKVCWRVSASDRAGGEKGAMYEDAGIEGPRLCVSFLASLSLRPAAKLEIRIYSTTTTTSGSWDRRQAGRQRPWPANAALQQSLADAREDSSGEGPHGLPPRLSSKPRTFALGRRSNILPSSVCGSQRPPFLWKDKQGGRRLLTPRRVSRVLTRDRQEWDLCLLDRTCGLRPD